ncbi:DUF1648 domain-containing protein [Geodermatophilus sp. SYSU D00708]
MTRAVFGASLLVLLVEVAVLAVVLPERVPLHFAAELTADRYGSRAAFLWVAVGTAAGTAALFAGLAAFVRRVRLEHVTVPHPGYWKTPEREPELRRRLVDDLLHVSTATFLLLTGVFAFVGHAALTGSDTLSPGAVVLVGVFVVGVLAWVGRLFTHRYRPPAHAS